MKITWTQEKKDSVCAEIEKWMKVNDASFGEAIMQSDRCLLSLPDFMCDLVDDIIKPEWEESDL